MTDKLETLRQYQSWRKGVDVRITAEDIDDAFDWAIAELEKRPAVPDKATGYPGCVPAEHGEAGAYYVEGWNDCRDEMLNASPRSAVPDGWFVEQDKSGGLLVKAPTGEYEPARHIGSTDVFARLIIAMLNAAPQPPSNSGWQPIETAPKDGTPIYVRRPATFVEDFCHVVVWDTEDEWWQVHDGKFFHPLRGDEPTEWKDIETPGGGEG